jgi:hypothetical protein
MKELKPLYVVIIALAVGAAAFFGGMQYQKSKTPIIAGFNNGSGNGRGGTGQGGNGQFQRRGGNNQGIRPVLGDIIATDDKSITVKLQDGSTKIVILSESTAINKADQAQKSDLKTGEKVMVLGPTNSDGSVTAQNIQLNPQQRMFGNPNTSDQPRPSGQ